MKKFEGIDYEALVQNALRDVVIQSLKLTSQHGLVDEHHFYISFLTDFPGVQMPDYLREEYPDEITIVLQFEYWDLKVEDKSFSVTLCFNDQNENLVVPFQAITSFVDPSVKFGLQFTPDYSLAEPVEAPKKTPLFAKKKEKIEETKEPSEDSNNVVTLDTFRKK